MVRSPCCSKEGINRGAWAPDEDMVLSQYISANGVADWRNLPEKAGLNRCGKSCRLRWLNYLRPDIKRGNISEDEEQLILRLHRLLGNRWSLIAGRLPGRTDNEIKNYWNTKLRKKCENPGRTDNEIKSYWNTRLRKKCKIPGKTDNEIKNYWNARLRKKCEKNSEDMCKNQKPKGKNEEPVTKTLPVKPVAIRPKVIIEKHTEKEGRSWEKPKNDSETRMPISLSWEEMLVWSGHDGENANMENLSNPVCNEDYGFDDIMQIFNPSNKSLSSSPSLSLASLEEKLNEWSNMDDLQPPFP